MEDFFLFSRSALLEADFDFWCTDVEGTGGDSPTVASYPSFSSTSSKSESLSSTERQERIFTVQNQLLNKE